MAMTSSRVVIGLDQRVFGERSHPLVRAAKIHHRSRGRRIALAIDLDTAGANRRERGRGSEGFQRSNLGTAHAPDAPGLLEDAGPPAPLGIRSLRDVIIAARREHARKALC